MAKLLWKETVRIRDKRRKGGVYAFLDIDGRIVAGIVCFNMVFPNEKVLMFWMVSEKERKYQEQITEALGCGGIFSIESDLELKNTYEFILRDNPLRTNTIPKRLRLRIERQLSLQNL